MAINCTERTQAEHKNLHFLFAVSRHGFSSKGTSNKYYDELYRLSREVMCSPFLSKSAKKVDRFQS